MGQMNPLFGFCQNNPNLAPYDALAQYVAQINAGQAQMNGQMQGGQARTASAAFGQFPVGASPAQPAHMNLPGASPAHMSGSPIPGHMQAPGMQLQQSQQGTAGTSSSGNPSANTSPASNKRRRPSAVKQEDDGTPGATSAPTPGGPASQVNGVVAGAKAKPPTPRMTKKQKLSNGP